MASKVQRFEIKKAIFQVNYKAYLEFYEKLFKLNKIFDKFPHWITDRLKITLKDYDKMHSLSIKHDAVIYDSDKFKEKEEEEIITILDDNFKLFANFDSINRVGHRFLCFIHCDLSFEDINELLKNKFISNEMLTVFNKESVIDHSVVIRSEINNYQIRIQIGPIKKKEVPEFIKFNAEHHIDQSSLSKFSQISNELDSYPDSALFFDLDISTDETIKSFNDFRNETLDILKELEKKISNWVFMKKIG